MICSINSVKGIFLIISFLFPGLIYPKVYYVSLNGSDKNPGTEEKPWRTIKYGCRKIKAGDILIVKPGDYGSEDIFFGYNGKRGSPVILKAEKPGKVILRDGHIKIGGEYPGKHHIIIEGIRFINCKGSSAISISDPASYIKIRKCIFEDGKNANGITIWGHSGGKISLTHHFEIYENQFIDTDDGAHQDYGLSMSYGMYAYVHNNYVFGIHHQAISFKRKWYYGIVENNVFEGFRYTAHYQGQNLEYKNDKGNRSKYLIAQWNVFRPAKNYRAKTPIWCANAEYCVIRYNYMEGAENIDGGWGAGIHISDVDKRGKSKEANPEHILIYGNIMRRIGGTTNNPGIRVLAKCTDVRVFHNTFAFCKRSIGSESPERVLFVNNIFYKYGRMVYEPKINNFVFENNCIFPDWKGKGKTDISKDPLLLGPFIPVKLKPLNPHFKPDFRIDACKLRSDSPCIDAGKFLTETVGSGRGKVIKVKDAGWFTDGFTQDIPDKEWFSGGFNGMQGSIIRVGKSGPLRVVKVDYENNLITVDKSIEWKDGEGVSLYFAGKRPDIGAFEYSKKGSFLIGTLR